MVTLQNPFFLLFDKLESKYYMLQIKPLQIISFTNLKHDADIGWDGEALTIWQGKKLVIIQHRVEVLHPLWVYISVKDNPLAFIDLTTYIVYDLPVNLRREKHEF